MAKKKRIVKEEDKEEEYEFVPPEFDEKEFILKDLYATKITIVVAVLAVIIGVLCSCLQKMFIDGQIGLYIGLALLFLGAFVQKKLLSLLGFKPEYLETKTMIGNYILFLLFGLGVWILMINAPFY